ncbi:MAG: YdbL family protein [Pseudomonadales bacterium]|nr:YdbL family protein [Pseudomonadales bacterium]
MKLFHILFLTIVSLTMSMGAWALDIDDAKASGLVGETTSGYLAAVSGSPSADVKSLIDNVNSKRKQKYEDIANKRKVPLQSVERLAAKKAYEKTQSGHFVQDPSGNWKKK